MAGIPVKVFSRAGLHADGWGETNMRFKIRPDEDVAVAQFDIWLKPESHRAFSRIWISVNNDAAFECVVEHNALTSVQVSCDCPAGQVARIAVGCDNLVLEKGQDARPLSYKLRAVHFS